MTGRRAFHVDEVRDCVQLENRFDERKIFFVAREHSDFSQPKIFFNEPQNFLRDRFDFRPTIDRLHDF